MKLRFFKQIAGSLAMALLLSFPAQAAQDFPFVLETDAGGSPRLCYCGHSGGGINYANGLTVTPETLVTLTSKHVRNHPGGDASLLALEIGLIYENADKTGTVREVLRRFERGSLSEGEQLPLLSDVVVANLRERHRLYSDSLHAIEARLSYGDSERRTTRMYFYICSDEEFYDHMNRGEQAVPAEEEATEEPGTDQMRPSAQTEQALLGVSPEMAEILDEPSDIPAAPPAGGGYRVIR